MSEAKTKTAGNSVRRSTKRSTAKIRTAKRAASRPATESLFPKVIKLSARDSKRLLAELASPPKPSGKLKKAAARYKRLIAGKKG